MFKFELSCRVVLLGDILDRLNPLIELYYKNSYVGQFHREELRETAWVKDRVIDTVFLTNEDRIAVYLTDPGRSF